MTKGPIFRQSFPILARLNNGRAITRANYISTDSGTRPIFLPKNYSAATTGTSRREVYRDLRSEEIFPLIRQTSRSQRQHRRINLPCQEKKTSYGQRIYRYRASNATFDDFSRRMDFACRGKLRGLSSSLGPFPPQERHSGQSIFIER